LDVIKYCCLYCRDVSDIINVGRYIYMCIRKSVERGWLAILIICRYGDMFLVVGILVNCLGMRIFDVLGLVDRLWGYCVVVLEFGGVGFLLLCC
jgi:hypothetical protein